MLRTMLAALTTALLSTTAGAQPNIIVIMLDDVPDNLSVLPKTSALLSLGTRYTNSFVNFPLCGPSRATFLTGQDADTHGVKGDGGFLAVKTGLVPQALRAANYTTALFGKNPNGFKGLASELGFAHWETIADIRDDRYFNPQLNIDGTTQPFAGYTTDIVFGRAQQWIDATPGPYFAWIASIGGHAPNDPAPRYVGACASTPFLPGPAFNEADVSDKPSFIRALPLYNTRKETKTLEKKFKNQCDTVQADDEWIERLVLAYANENTCVFLTADNGFLHGQHRVTGKTLLYDESIRVPLVWWGCGAALGAADARLVSNADLPATILALAGATPGRPLDGYSLVGEPRQQVRLNGVWDRKGARGTSNGVRDAASAQFTHSSGEREFYAMSTDPYQLTSLPPP